MFESAALFHNGRHGATQDLALFVLRLQGGGRVVGWGPFWEIMLECLCVCLQRIQCLAVTLHPFFVASRMTELNEFEFNVALRPQRPYGLFHFGTSREPRTATSTLTRLLSSEIFHTFVQCCFTSTETVFRDGYENSPGRPPRLSRSS